MIIATLLTSHTGEGVGPLIIVGAVVSYVVTLLLSRGPKAYSGTAADTEASTQRGLGGQLVTARTGGAPFAHPYFWAPFILIGNWR